MKKVFAAVIIGLLCLSIFSMFTLKVRGPKVSSTRNNWAVKARIPQLARARLGKFSRYNAINRFESIIRSIVGKMFLRVEVVVFETSIQTGVASRSWAARDLAMSANKAKVNVRLAGIDDIPKFERFEDFRGRKAARALERFKANHLCFIAEENGKIVCYAWIAFHEEYIDVIERKIRIDPRSVYGYNEYTDPEYRGLGILPAVLMISLNYLSQHGIKCKYAIAYSHNFSAIRAHEKIGARKMGTVTELRLFKSRRYICKGETQEDFHKLREMFSI